MVKILSGKNRGQTGKVIQVFPKLGKVVVEGKNIMKKHLKSHKAGEKGQLVELAAPLDVSKVMIISAKSNRPMRVGYKIEGGVKKRFSHKHEEYID